MYTIQNTKYTFFITDKNYIFPKENDNIVIQKYFDISKNRLFSFIFQDNDLFIILNQNTFGSAFFGNTVITEPMYFLIKKFNPIFILIQILYGHKNEEETKQKNKKLGSNDFVDTSAIIQNYEDNLKSLKDKNELFNNINFDTIFKSSKNFVKTIFAKFSKNLELISEIKEIENDLEGEKKICAKKCESKIFSFLNTKVNLNSSDNKEIEESGIQDEKEKEILINRKIYEKITILEPFLPNYLVESYLKYKHIEFLDEDEISKMSNCSNKSANKTNKRKKGGEKSEKKQKNKNKNKNNKESEVKLTKKDQKTIFDLFNKPK